jgi:hypothetical protein
MLEPGELGSLDDAELDGIGRAEINDSRPSAYGLPGMICFSLARPGQSGDHHDRKALYAGNSPCPFSETASRTPSGGSRNYSQAAKLLRMTSSPNRLLAPITLQGCTGLSVEIKTKASTPCACAAIGI